MIAGWPVKVAHFGSHYLKRVNVSRRYYQRPLSFKIIVCLWRLMTNVWCIIEKYVFCVTPPVSRRIGF